MAKTKNKKTNNLSKAQSKLTVTSQMPKRKKTKEDPNATPKRIDPVPDPQNREFIPSKVITQVKCYITWMSLIVGLFGLAAFIIVICVDAIHITKENVFAEETREQINIGTAGITISGCVQVFSAANTFWVGVANRPTMNDTERLAFCGIFWASVGFFIAAITFILNLYLVLDLRYSAHQGTLTETAYRSLVNAKTMNLIIGTYITLPTVTLILSLILVGVTVWYWYEMKKLKKGKKRAPVAFQG